MAFAARSRHSSPATATAGIPGGRFPFRPTTSQGAQLDGAFASVFDWVQPRAKAIARSRCRSLGLGQADADDLCQLVLEDVWRRALPGFDRDRGTPLEAYLTRCMHNSARKRVKGILARRRTSASGAHLPAAAGRLDPIGDDRIERLSQAVMRNPHAYMEPEEADLLAAVVQNDQRPRADVARSLGVSVSTFDRRLASVRRSVAELVHQVIPG